ncbi:hypothetical protein NQ318_005682 [Aromia moschata]|uniref:CCHC-type domain-containing protein n=1 Tax=Aromia moschata TaxID=1265417 RepID=A0AAV8X153_9CUCU|nr:hypothetical protein NQ318_005682 [Aromia moschata]
MEKVELEQCYRCWQYGHIKEKCQNKDDRSDACRCGGAGNKVKDCQGSNYCLGCRSDGHMVGTGRCPQFREALSRARLNQRQKREGREMNGVSLGVCMNE